LVTLGAGLVTVKEMPQPALSWNTARRRTVEPMNAREQGIRSAAVITAALALVGVGGAVAVAAVVSHSDTVTTTGGASSSQLSTGAEPMARTGGS
jgi:hypothetical protein